MKVRSVFALMLSVMLLLTAGPGLAFGAQPTGASYVDDMNADPVANAPWFNIEVDTPGDTGQHTSVAINQVTDTTYVSYYDYTNKTLRLAMNKGFGIGNCGPNNSWLCQTVDTTYGVGQYSSIAVNPSNGEIGIAYYDATNRQLKYAHGEICPTCTWSKDIIDKPLLPSVIVGQYASLKYHSDGTPYIAYYFENTSNVDSLKVASYVGSGGVGCSGSVASMWKCDSIQTGEGVGQFASLALDGAGNRHIAYYDGSNGDLWYATSSTGANCGPGMNTWLCYPVDSLNDVGKYASLYVDNGNDFHIAYYDATTDKLKYAFDKGSGGNCGVLGSAQCDTIDSMPPDIHPLGVSIAEDSAGYPIIAYQSVDGSLKAARPLPALGLPGGSGNCGPEIPFSTWHCETIDPDNPWVPYRNGDFVSIALHPSGLATIAYYGFITSTQGNLNVSSQRFQIYLPVGVKN
jgi:hypothetical protein